VINAELLTDCGEGPTSGVQLCGRTELGLGPTGVGPAGDSPACDVADHSGAAHAEAYGDVSDAVARDVRRQDSVDVVGLEAPLNLSGGRV